jgi:hypothetical protein
LIQFGLAAKAPAHEYVTQSPIKTTLGEGVAAEAEKKAEKNRVKAITVTLECLVISRCLPGSWWITPGENKIRNTSTVRLRRQQLIGRR